MACVYRLLWFSKHFRVLEVVAAAALAEAEVGGELGP